VDDKDSTKSLQRREFFKVAALGVGASTLRSPELEGAQAAPEVADLLIIGAGTAGLPAAIHGADLGAKIVLLEKNEAIGGTLHVSGGQMSAANTKLQIAKGFDDSPSRHYRDVLRIGRFLNSSDLVKLDVENAGPMIDWLQDIGVEFTLESPFLFYGHEVYSVARTHQPVASGRTLLEAFRRELDKRIARGDVAVHFGIQAKKLIKDKEGRVSGITAEDKSGRLREFRSRAVILATGGYGASSDLINKYNPQYRTAVWGGMPHATGDGIVMAQELAAKLTHMDYLIPSPGAVEDPRNPGSALRGVRLQLSPQGFAGAVWVNKAADRFVNEDGYGQDEKERALAKQPGMTFFVVFDEKARNANSPILAGWTKERFEQEADRGEIIKKADSIEALAGKIGVSAARLRETVSRYNGFVEAGTDLEFGRDKMKYPLAQSPFYAIRTIGTFLLTMGGIKVNSDLAVEDEKGRVIPGLYAAGEVLGNGQLAGAGMVGGMSVTPAITFGRIAARNALQYGRALRV